MSIIYGSSTIFPYTGSSGSTASYSYGHNSLLNDNALCVSVFHNSTTDDFSEVTLNGHIMQNMTSTVATQSGAANLLVKTFFIAQKDVDGNDTYFSKVPFHNYAATELSGGADIAYGNGIWLKRSSSLIKKADDYTSATWTTLNVFPDVNYSGRAVCYHDGYWYASGFKSNNPVANVVYYASENDLTTWNSTSGSLTSSDFSFHKLRSLNGYLIYTLGNKLYYTTGPTTAWTEVTGVFGALEVIRDVSYGNGYYGIVTETKVWYATDITNSNTYVNVSNTGGTSLAFGRGYWVKANAGVTYNSDITVDNWQTPTGSVSNLEIVAFGNQNYLKHVTIGSTGVFVAAGTNGVMRTAEAPNLTWSAPVSVGATPLNSTTTIQAIAYGSDNDITGRSWVVCNTVNTYYAEDWGISVTRNSNANANNTISSSFQSQALRNMEIFEAGIQKINGNRVLLLSEGGRLIDDGNFSLEEDRKSIRVLLTNSTTTNTPTAISGTTRQTFMALGTGGSSRRHCVFIEDINGQASRMIGAQNASVTEYAGVYFAIREVQSLRALKDSSGNFFAINGVIIGRSI